MVLGVFPKGKDTHVSVDVHLCTCVYIRVCVCAYARLSVFLSVCLSVPKAPKPKTPRTLLNPQTEDPE